MTNNVNRKLGKAAPKHDKRTLQMATYGVGQLAAPPDNINWTAKANSNFGMMLNDQLGDCTCAGMGHATQVWSAANGNEITLPDAAILKAYEEACGYNPADTFSDKGGVELDVLNYWRQTGIGGYKIDAFMALEPQNQLHVKQGINLFGGCYVGLALPNSTLNQNGVWHLSPGGSQGDPTPGSRGGHCVYCVGYDSEVIYFITWGELWKMTFGFWNAYCDESYVCISDLWVPTNKLAPSGFPVDTLKADLQLVTA